MNNTRKLGWKRIGIVGVDAGLIMIGDPCYVNGDNPANALVRGDWGKFCDFTFREDNQKHGNTACEIPCAMGHSGAGVLVSSGYGDGNYDVYAKFVNYGGNDIRVAEARIVFIESESTEGAVCEERT